MCGRGAPELHAGELRSASRCAQVDEALRHAAAIDRMIKGLAKGDVWDELLQLALRFATRRRRRRDAARARARGEAPRVSRADPAPRLGSSARDRPRSRNAAIIRAHGRPDLHARRRPRRRARASRADGEGRHRRPRTGR